MDLLGPLIGVPLGIAGVLLGLWLLAHTSRERGRSSIDGTARSRGRLLAVVFGGIFGGKRD